MKLYKIKKSGIDNKGRGLYATRDIKEGTKIIDYVGKLITKKQTQDSDKYDNSKPIYLFTLNNRYTLDGDFHWNTAGLINHSCNNNCDYEGKGFKVWVSAIRDIKKGEELVGYYEQEYHPALNEVELINLGVIKEFRGLKLGSTLANHAIASASRKNPERMWVHTCSLDHKYALQNYKSKGFEIFKEEEIDFVA